MAIAPDHKLAHAIAERPEMRLAMGFIGPETDGMIEQLGLELDQRTNIKADENWPGVVSAAQAGSHHGRRMENALYSASIVAASRS